MKQWSNLSYTFHVMVLVWHSCYYQLFINSSGNHLKQEYNVDNQAKCISVKLFYQPFNEIHSDAQMVKMPFAIIKLFELLSLFDNI